MPDRTPSRSGGNDRSRSSRGPAGGARSGAPRSGAPRSGAPRNSGPRTGPTRTGPARGAPASARPGPGKERPALAARARSRPPEPPSQSTTWIRGAILLGIVVMLAVTLVPTLRSVIQQRNDTFALQERVAQQTLTVEELQKEAALWKDPKYIEEQARKRLRFVRVGDRAYSVTGLTADQSEEQSVQDPIVAAPMANESSPWYGKLWQSVQIADRPTAGLTR